MRRECDLVMKGGVTSGIVYPPAIAAIAQSFDLRNIGGTSAGAIAAALAAAAQYRRVADTRTPEAGYEQLATLPAWLGQNGHLFGLFAPSPSTQNLFNTVVALAGPGKSAPQRIAELVKAYGTGAAIGAVPGLLHALIAGKVEDPGLRALHRVAAFAGFLSGTFAGGAIALLADAASRLNRNYYGMVTGVVEGNDDALCTWLAARTEEIAGLEAGKTPLTFGMLWDPQRAPGKNALLEPATDARIGLQMMTTCIVGGRPYVFPTRTNQFRFRESEMRRFFPDHVVNWMLAASRPSSESATLEGETLVPLPPIGDLPIIVATRMSLAFPILLSAVPLYTLDHANDKVTPRRVLFSDGGLASNFPISLFDSPLPRRPTLAINLGGFPDGVVESTSTDIVMADGNMPYAIYPDNPVKDIASFGAAVFSTMQNWNDSVLARLPGYRDRIVTVRLTADQGGLNLAMDQTTINKLVDRGRRAGEMLVERFAAPSDLAPLAGKPNPMTWENHRWVRFRTILVELRDLLAAFASSWGDPNAGDVPYVDLVRAAADDTIPRHSYPLPDDQAVRDRVAELAGAVARLGDMLSNDADSVQHAPHPAPSLVTRARLDRA
jgi:predicted acylesterase/phospholipase RssA